MSMTHNRSQLATTTSISPFVYCLVFISANAFVNCQFTTTENQNQKFALFGKHQQKKSD